MTTTLTTLLQSQSESTRNMVVYVGRTLNQRCFLTNNRLFFDFLLSYLPKNGWTQQDQYLRTEMRWNGSRSFITETRRGESKQLGFQIPVQRRSWFEESSKARVDKRTGTYIDVVCHSCEIQRVPSESNEALPWIQELGEQRDRVFANTVDEITIFGKPTCPIQVQFAVTKGSHPSETAYTVQLLIHGSLDGYREEIDALVVVVEMAMARYKKMEHTTLGVFQ